MRYFIVSFFTFCFLNSCGKKEKSTSDVVSKEKMELLLWDMMRADQYVTIYILPKDSSLKKEEEQKKWYNKVFAFHKLSEKQFQQSFQYYKNRPEVLKNILDTISYSKKYQDSAELSIIPKHSKVPASPDSLKKNFEEVGAEYQKKYGKPQLQSQ